MIIAMFVGIVAALSVIQGTILPAILAIVIGAMISYIYKKRTHETLEDERTQLINEKAATMTLGILIAVVIYAGIIIVALRNSYPQFLQVGYILFVVAFSCFILYFASRAYYSRKY